LRLRYSSFFEYNAKPILSGRVERTATGTILRLVYRSPYATHVFLVFWYLILIATTGVMLTGGTEPALEGSDRSFPFAIIGLLVVAPIGMHFVGTRNADAELEELLDFLERVAEARQEPSVLPGGRRHE
jgi:hypothetical protein